DGGPPLLYLDSKADELYARVSPDSKWLAYTTDQSGRPEVWISSFPKPGKKSQISTNGGLQPVWRKDGKELYYIDAENKFVAVQLHVDSSGLEASDPQELFTAPKMRAYDTRHQYAVLDNGQKFIFNARYD